jgi:hypothetical protein
MFDPLNDIEDRASILERQAKWLRRMADRIRDVRANPEGKEGRLDGLVHGYKHILSGHPIPCVPADISNG